MYIYNGYAHVEVGEFSLYEFDGPFVDMVENMQQIINDKVPEEFRDRVTLDFETKDNYGDGCLPYVTMSYKRLATQRELDEQEKSKDTRRQSEIQQLQRRIAELEHME